MSRRSMARSMLRNCCGAMRQKRRDGNSMNSYRRGASAEEDFRSVRGTGTVSDEKRERIRKLKELRDSGVMTKEEYDQMVDRIKRS